MALTRERKMDNGGLRLADKSSSPESHNIRGICFVVRDHLPLWDAHKGAFTMGHAGSLSVWD